MSTLTFKCHGDDFETENELDGIGERARLRKTEPRGAPEERQEGERKEKRQEIPMTTAGEANDDGADEGGKESVGGVGATEEEEEEETE